MVGHRDETQAGDEGIVSRLVELLLGRVITGEPLCRFCHEQHTRRLWLGLRVSVWHLKPLLVRSLTKAWWLEWSLFHLFFQLCQRSVIDQLLLKNIRSFSDSCIITPDQTRIHQSGWGSFYLKWLSGGHQLGV